MVGKITNWKLGIIGLYRGDYLAVFHIREMAKQLGTSHVALRPHLKSLEEERILDSHTKGRNREYSLNLSNISTKKYMVLAEEAAAIDYLEKVFFVKMLLKEMQDFRVEGTIALFGSQVKGYSTDASDFDLLHVGNLTEKQAKDIRSFGSIYRKRIDLKRISLRDFKDCLRKRDVLIWQVVSDHIILQGSSLWVDILWMYTHEIAS